MACGVVAVWFMLQLMGRRGDRQRSAFYRRLHKTFGFVFLALLLLLSYYCARFVRIGGDNLPVRAVIHSVLALALFIALAIKLLIVQFYREFLRIVPTLGLLVFALAFMVYSTSAGYFFLVRSGHTPVADVSRSVKLSVDEIEGMRIFERECSFCHNADSAEPKLGPGLKGILDGERSLVSGKPATRENVTEQLLNPVGGMPSFASKLETEEMQKLLAYLETL
jgi:hypothetical protein